MGNVSGLKPYCRTGAASGFTLLELVATLSVLLVLAVAASSILGNVTEIGINRRDHAESRAAVMRFAGDFRRDAGSADEIKVSDDGASIEMRLKTDRIEYRWNDSSKRLVRAKSRKVGNQVSRSSDLMESDSYALGPRCDPRFTDGDERVFVVLRKQAGASPPWIVEVTK